MLELVIWKTFIGNRDSVPTPLLSTVSWSEEIWLDGHLDTENLSLVFSYCNLKIRTQSWYILLEVNNIWGVFVKGISSNANQHIAVNWAYWKKWVANMLVLP